MTAELIPLSQTSLNMAQYDLAYWHHQLTSDEIVSPSYQRNNCVWEQRDQSKLIESFLLAKAVPPVFLEAGSPKHIIDGLQRLSTWRRFRDDQLKLTGLERLPDFNGLRYSDLSISICRRLNSRVLGWYCIPEGEGPAYFEDLNRQTPLNTMERITSQHQGSGAAFIKDLAQLLVDATPSPRRATLTKRRDHETHTTWTVVGLLLEWKVFEESHCPELGFGRFALRRGGNDWRQAWLTRAILQIDNMSDMQRQELRRRWILTFRAVICVFPECWLEKADSKTHRFNSMASVLQFALIAMVGADDAMRGGHRLRDIYRSLAITGQGRGDLENNYLKMRRSLALRVVEG